MDPLLILANVANEKESIPTLKQRRIEFLKTARLRMAQIRAKKTSYVKHIPKPKKVVNQNWRHENIKKAQAAIAKKRAYEKMIAQDTEPEE
jgi:hypothetical protein